MDAPPLRAVSEYPAHPVPDLRGGALGHMPRQSMLTILLTGILTSGGSWAASHFTIVTRDQLDAVVQESERKLMVQINALSLASAKELDNARNRGFAEGVATITESKKPKDDRGRRGRRHRNTANDESDGDEAR